MRRPDYRPLLITGAVSVAGLAMLLLGTAYGWLGPDRDYGAQFCEVAHWRYFAQPANTLSNLGFVAAGLALAWRARWPGAHLTPPSLTTPFAVIVALLGPASMAMHATESALGGQLDVLSMQLLASFAAAHRGEDDGRVPHHHADNEAQPQRVKRQVPARTTQRNAHPSQACNCQPGITGKQANCHVAWQTLREEGTARDVESSKPQRQHQQRAAKQHAADGCRGR